MIVLLWLIAACAALSTALGLVGLLAASTSSATVFQQISARVDVGFSLLVFVTATGFAGILRRMDQRPPSHAPPAQQSTTSRGPSEFVETYQGKTITKRGDTHSAIIDGEAVMLRDLEALKRRIDQSKH